MIHIADIILERFDVVDISCLLFIELSDLFFHTVSFGNEIFDDEIHVVIGAFEVNDLTVHVGYLLSHFGDLILSGAYISFQLFDFIIKDKFEFLQLLSFFLELVDSGYFISDSFLSLLNLFGLRLFSLKILFMFLFDFLDIF